MNSIEVTPEIARQTEVSAFMEEFYEGRGVPMKTIMSMNIVLDEIFSNIVYYSGAASVKVSCDVVGQTAILTIEDDGSPYDPTQTKEPDVTLAAEEREVGGLGIFMVRKMMDEVVYHREDGRNCLQMKKSYDK